METLDSLTLKQMVDASKMTYTFFDVPTSLIVLETDKEKNISRLMEVLSEEYNVLVGDESVLIIREGDDVWFINGDKLSELFNKGVDNAYRDHAEWYLPESAQGEEITED